MEIYNIIYYIDRKKDKTTSSEVMHKKHSTKFSIPSLYIRKIKIKKKLEIGKNYLNIMKGIMKKSPTKNCNLHSKKLKVFHLTLGTRQGCHS